MAIMQGTVATPAKAGDGIGTALLGRNLDQLVSELHGKWYNAAYANRLFVGSALIAGVTIPVNTTTAPTFTLFNPAGSNVNLELVTLDVGWPAAATTVVATLLASLSTQTPTSVTSGGVTLPMPMGAGGNALAKLYTAATITAITSHIPLLQITSTADAMVASHYEFDGRVVIAPGSLVSITSTPVQTGVAIPSICWAEWPV